MSRWFRSTFAVSVGALMALQGCTGSEPGPTELVDAQAWVIQEAADDPFADHRPEDTECNVFGVLAEGGILEVRTDVCPYASLQQPALIDVSKGDPIEWLVYHNALYNEEPAQGHMAIFIGGEVVWEETVDIPGAAEVYSGEAALDEAITAGDPIVFHVHNHGANSWKLVHIRRAD